MHSQPPPAADVLNDLTHALSAIGRYLAAAAVPLDGRAAPILAITGPHTTITVEGNPDNSHRISIDIHPPQAA